MPLPVCNIARERLLAREADHTPLPEDALRSLDGWRMSAKGISLPMSRQARTSACLVRQPAGESDRIPPSAAPSAKLSLACARNPCKSQRHELVRTH